MSKGIIQAMILLNVTICFTACKRFEADSIDGAESNKVTINQKANSIESSETNISNDNLYERYLKNEEVVMLDDEEIGIYSYGDDVQYVMMDIDGDDREELCVRAHPAFYILKDIKGRLSVIYSGATYDEPINNNDLVGVYWYRTGAAPIHDDYKFVSFNNGTVDNIEYYSWYDENGNGEMDEVDNYSEHYYDEKDTMSMEEWLELAHNYLDYRDYHADWIDLQ
ncbi:MAG: hypothetical protein K5883_10455 [Pseudobutyrivibrio sp.]|nr:hypothetical protein [Pseudobutyrivibrio sp.]